jgi:hypothetical protein
MAGEGKVLQTCGVCELGEGCEVEVDSGATVGWTCGTVVARRVGTLNPAGSDTGLGGRNVIVEQALADMKDVRFVVPLRLLRIDEVGEVVRSGFVGADVFGGVDGVELNVP